MSHKVWCIYEHTTLHPTRSPCSYGMDRKECRMHTFHKWMCTLVAHQAWMSWVIIMVWKHQWVIKLRMERLHNEEANKLHWGWRKFSHALYIRSIKCMSHTQTYKHTHLYIYLVPSMVYTKAMYSCMHRMHQLIKGTFNSSVLASL